MLIRSIRRGRSPFSVKMPIWPSAGEVPLMSFPPRALDSMWRSAAKLTQRSQSFEVKGRKRSIASPAPLLLKYSAQKLTAFEKIRGVRRSKFPEKIEVIGNSGFHRRQRPSDCLRLEMRAFRKNSAGKMEFSRCRTAGSSPALRRSSSARRDARFSASRASRLNFSDGFMAAGSLMPSL